MGFLAVEHDCILRLLTQKSLELLFVRAGHQIKNRHRRQLAAVVAKHKRCNVVRHGDAPVLVRRDHGLVLRCEPSGRVE